MHSITFSPSLHHCIELSLNTLQITDGLDLVACHKDCAVWGTRGYIITYDGAQKMLKHAYPIQTQIDALLSLVARSVLCTCFH
jgi:hypothetical protein